ncbi:hypothetical protein BU16DRAFT_564067 [Lophium mytilinum]|uniref:Uncharacterized protein n=1 Tax=Lophium mytilinum TaxID=390894 RepID=A0A6A6QLA0_9PEZI|nr:hypothetical protein BU16DRAFT_564067 [Lophium mytilinum]
MGRANGFCEWPDGDMCGARVRICNSGPPPRHHWVTVLMLQTPNSTAEVLDVHAAKRVEPFRALLPLPGVRVLFLSATSSIRTLLKSPAISRDWVKHYVLASPIPSTPVRAPPTTPRSGRQCHFLPPGPSLIRAPPASVWSDRLSAFPSIDLARTPSLSSIMSLTAMARRGTKESQQGRGLGSAVGMAVVLSNSDEDLGPRRESAKSMIGGLAKWEVVRIWEIHGDLEFGGTLLGAALVGTFSVTQAWQGEHLRCGLHAILGMRCGTGRLLREGRYAILLFAIDGVCTWVLSY